ncbi:MAG: FecR family protein, partial [Planctomycetales bacterium]|nr:FecR family protein [Planctomycetales bacterium]
MSDAFSEGDSVRCGPDGSCGVLLDVTGARVGLEAGTEIRWKRLTDDAGARRIEVELSSGRVVPAVPAGFPFVVATRGARARVRGASGSVGVGRRGTMVSVLSGFVEVVDATDPSRRVQAAAGTAVDFGEGGADARPLTAEERARLAREAERGGGAIRRTAPRAGEAPGDAGPAGRGPVAPVADGAPAGAGAAAAPGEEAPEAKVLTGEAAVVADVLRRGLGLLDEGSVSEALALTTPTFRALVQGSLSSLTAATTTEISRGDAVAAAQRLSSRLSLRLRVQSVDAVLDGDVAWGSAVVLATATLSGTGKTLARTYSCLARCVRTAEGWRVDLVTASEGG